MLRLFIAMGDNAQSKGARRICIFAKPPGMAGLNFIYFSSMPGYETPLEANKCFTYQVMVCLTVRYIIV